ncbi:hypothetical protein QEO92_04075 [Neorhizobium petrolearium]|uniref:Uncharacterized protein n=2 Tax=Neorhizobium petrolearium TaxID=515361 RepID=A0ABY8M753_9HYPH|nr:hypothetical protein [Neorhizobium petrolearium]WGI69275.1 hypothetical protein QEO92_04075 [Neorhizobium petrolearium]
MTESLATDNLKGSAPAQFFDCNQTLSNHRHAVKDYFPIFIVSYPRSRATFV